MFKKKSLSQEKERTPGQANSFGAYLKSAAESLQNEPKPPKSGTNYQLLHLLSETDARPLSELLTVSELTLSEFSESIEALKKMNMINIQKQENREVAKLTELGRKFSV